MSACLIAVLTRRGKQDDISIGDRPSGPSRYSVMGPISTPILACFTPDITAGSFSASYPAIRIVQTGSDVSLQGYLAGSPIDPNALPVHA